jgi:hypothetical protein
VKYVFSFLLLVVMLNGCMSKMLAPIMIQSFQGYVKANNLPNHAAASLGSMPAN